jgi:hypothetical protein
MGIFHGYVTNNQRVYQFMAIVDRDDGKATSG